MPIFILVRSMVCSCTQVNDLTGAIMGGGEKPCAHIEVIDEAVANTYNTDVLT